MMSTGLKRGGLFWLILLLGLGLFPLGLAATQVTDIQTLDPESGQIWLNDSLSVYRDHSDQLSFEEIRSAEQRGDFQPVTGLAVTSGFMTDKPIWIHFAVRYPANSSPTWWLLLTPDILSKITIYAEQADGRFIIHHGGSALPFAQREMPGVGHGFKLGQDPGGLRHYFIRVTGILSARVEPSLWQEKPLIDYIGRYRGTLGLYVGILSVLILMALGRALRYRRPLDIAYVSYLIGFELFNLGHNGVHAIVGSRRGSIDTHGPDSAGTVPHRFQLFGGDPIADRLACRPFGLAVATIEDWPGHDSGGIAARGDGLSGCFP